MIWLLSVHKDKFMDDKNPREKDAELLAKKLRFRGITDDRVLRAIATVPRHLFVEKILYEEAYHDKPLPIDKGQTISQPFTVAYQTQLLQLKEKDKVLEVGTGSGYQAAILCEIVKEVYSIERYESLHLKAKRILAMLNYQAHLFFGDGYEGLPQYAPFDKILITAAVKEVPTHLLSQLAIGGRMVLPIGGQMGQVMTAIDRLTEDDFHRLRFETFIFVPMIKGTIKNEEHQEED